jgi:DNA-damage-inducible protein D
MAIAHTRAGLESIIGGTGIRQAQGAGQRWFAVVDVVAALVDTADAGQYWTDLKSHEPALGDLAKPVEFHAESGETAILDAVRMDGVLRLVQSIPSRKAERVKRWLARTARQHLDEADNPELAVLRTRKLYQRKGYAPRWVDARLRGMSARHELTAEWFKRGVAESDDYRELTNELMRSAFGMDAQGFRNYKRLAHPGLHLRDHLSDLELALLTLAETLAVTLHRERGSREFPLLHRDVTDAGAIAAETRQAIESRTGKPLVTPRNHAAWWASSRAKDKDRAAGKQVA